MTGLAVPVATLAAAVSEQRADQKEMLIALRVMVSKVEHLELYLRTEHK